MPTLALASRAAAAAVLLALIACGSGTAGNNAASEPDSGNLAGASQNMMVPDASETPAPAPTMAAPQDEPDAGGPRNSFIVCPGNPRCPPAGGTRPADKPD